MSASLVPSNGLHAGWGFYDLHIDGKLTVGPLARPDLLALADDLAAILDTDSGYKAKHARAAP